MSGGRTWLPALAAVLLLAAAPVRAQEGGSTAGTERQLQSLRKDVAAQRQRVDDLRKRAVEARQQADRAQSRLDQQDREIARLRAQLAGMSAPAHAASSP